MIDLKKLKELIDLMKEHDLSEIDLRDGEETVTLKRPLGAPAAPAPVYAAPPPPPPVAHAPAAHASGGAPAPAVDDGLEPIESPMVGTFYTAPSPDSPPFVQSGSAVGPDSVVCLIEAMKVFNEIKAEVSGRVTRLARTGRSLSSVTRATTSAPKPHVRLSS